MYCRWLGKATLRFRLQAVRCPRSKCSVPWRRFPTILRSNHRISSCFPCSCSPYRARCRSSTSRPCRRTTPATIPIAPKPVFRDTRPRELRICCPICRAKSRQLPTSGRRTPTTHPKTLPTCSFGRHAVQRHWPTAFIWVRITPRISTLGPTRITVSISRSLATARWIPV